MGIVGGASEQLPVAEWATGQMIGDRSMSMKAFPSFQHLL